MSAKRACVKPLPMLAAALCACGGGDKGAPAPSADSTVLSSPARSVLSGQSTVRLTRGTAAETLEVPVRLEADARRGVEIIAPADGRIEDVAVRDRDQYVRAGEPTASLYSPELAAAQRELLLIDPRKDPALARAAGERLARLGLSPDAIRALRAGGAIRERVPIPSPRDGYVLPVSPGPGNASGPSAMTSSAEGGAMGGMGSMGTTGGSSGEAAETPASPSGGVSPLRAGTYVLRGTALATVNDLAHVAAALEIPAAWAALFREGDSAHLDLAEAGFAGMVRLDFLAARVPDSGGNVLAFAYLPNPGGRLKPGLLGRAHLVSRPDSAWVLPRDAVHALGDRFAVWARAADDSGAFEAREVRVGRIGARFVEILDGLAPGAEVAARASLLLDPDMAWEPWSLPLEGDAEEPEAGHEDHAGHGAPDGDAEKPGAGGEHAGHGAARDGQAGNAAVGAGHTGHTGAQGGSFVEPSSNGGHAGHGAVPGGASGETATALEHTGHGGSAAWPSGASGEAVARSGNASASLRVSAEKARLAGVRIRRARVSRIVPTQYFRGVAVLDDRGRTVIAARAEGRLVRVSVLRPGETVSRGRILATLESETLAAAQEDYLSALRAGPGLSVAMAASQAAAARRRLVLLGLASADLDALARSGRVPSGIPIPSPADGIVMEVSARPGAYVQAGAPLFILGDPDRVWIETWLLRDEAESYPPGTEAWAEVEGLHGQALRGRLEHVRQEAGSGGTMVAAHVILENARGRVLPGMPARVGFRGPGREVLNVPASALLRDSRGATLWVAIGPGTFAPRRVRTGLQAGDRVEIAEGLAPGEDVAVAGVYLLDSEWRLRHGSAGGHAGHGGH